jgi:hypothetical protein
MIYRIKYHFILILLLTSSYSLSQLDVSGWDNQLYFSNKITFGKPDWRFSADLSMRFKDDIGAMDVIFGEFVASYLATKNFEIVPDIRLSRKDNHLEIRPGMGFIYKSIVKRFQFVHQLKWQMDIGTDNKHSQSVRYVFFVNYLPIDKVVISAVVGTFGEFSAQYSGWMGIRAGLGVAYIFDKLHSINFGYYYGLFNQKNGSFTNLGIINFQLIININKEYKYIPAKYYMF